MFLKHVLVVFTQQIVLFKRTIKWRVKIFPWSDLIVRHHCRRISVSHIVLSAVTGCKKVRRHLIVSNKSFVSLLATLSFSFP